MPKLHLVLYEAMTTSSPSLAIRLFLSSTIRAVGYLHRCVCWLCRYVTQTSRLQTEYPRRRLKNKKKRNNNSNQTIFRIYIHKAACGCVRLKQISPKCYPKSEGWLGPWNVSYTYHQDALASAGWCQNLDFPFSNFVCKQRGHTGLIF